MAVLQPLHREWVNVYDIINPVMVRRAIWDRNYGRFIDLLGVVDRGANIMCIVRDTSSTGTGINSVQVVYTFGCFCEFENLLGSFINIKEDDNRTDWLPSIVGGMSIHPLGNKKIVARDLR